MALGDSEVSICNRGIQKLGSATRITALTQNLPAAIAMNVAYTSVRNAMLRFYNWNFAIARASVAKDASQTIWDNLNRYTLPNDFLRLIRKQDFGDVRRKDWRVEGLFIITADKSPLQFKYVALITDPTQFDAMFVEALATNLAFETCKAITGSTEMKVQLRQDLKEIMSDAKLANAIENDPEEPVEDSWVSAMRQQVVDS